MTNHVRTSGVNHINNLRKVLLEQINFNNMKLFTRHLYNNFIPNTIKDIDFDLNRYFIIIESSGRPFEYDDIYPRINNAYKCFIQDMFRNGKINKDEFDSCMDNINTLYNITFAGSYAKISL